MATVMNISVQITGSAAGLQKSVTSANGSLNTLGSSATKTGGILSKMGSYGPMLTAGLGVAVIGIGKAFLEAGMEAERVNAQTVAGLKSTGNAANVTLVDVQNLANGIMSYSGISDEAIQTGENMLLTFTNIRNEVGAGNDIFTQANTALADMATKMAGGTTPSAEAMSSAAIKLGKALNDPMAGMTALSRVGVLFTAEQKAQIAAMVASGDTMGAQKAILSELTTEFGGSAAAMGKTFTGQLNIMKETLMNVVEAIVTGFFAILKPIVTALIPVFQVIGQAAQVFGNLLAGAFRMVTPLIQPLLVGIAAIATVILAAFIPAIVASGIAFVTAWAPIIAIGAVVAAVVAAIGAAVIGMVKLVQAGLSALSGGWSKMSGGMKMALIVLAPLWLPIVGAIKLVQAAIGLVVKAVTAVYNAVKPFVADFISGLQSIAGFLGDVIGWLGQAAGAVAGWIAEFAKGIPIVSQIIDIVGAIGDTAAANAQSASAEVRTLGLSVITAAKTSNVAVTDMAQNLDAYHQALIATGQETKWADTMAVGVAKIDALLKNGSMTADQAQKAYLAWGMSTAQATQKVNTLAPALQKTNAAMTQTVQVGWKTADAMSKAWGNVGPKVAGSLKQIAAAITKAVVAEAKMAQNTQKVTNRLINDFGLTEEQAQRSLADATPQAMATMAKASDKDFRKVGTAIQKANHIIPTVGKSMDAAGKAAQGATKGTDGLSKSVDKTSAAVKGGAKSHQELAKATEQEAKGAKSAQNATQSLGNTVQSGQSKVAGLTSNVAKLGSELNGLPKNITIHVTVNITKTGAALGGIVPGLARGGVTTMTNGLPLTMVGERGPELAALPPGTRVFSHQDTQSMLNQAAGSIPSGAAGGQSISGKLTLVNGEAYIEGVIVDTLADGRLVNGVLTRSMKRPGGH